MDIVQPLPAISNGRTETFFLWLDSIAIYGAGLALSGLALMITIDVLSRYFLNAPLPASVEISQLVLPYVVTVPMAVTLARGGHVKVTLLTQLLPPPVIRVISIAVLVSEFLICATVSVFGWKEFWSSYSVNETMMAVIPLPWWVGKFAFPLGLGLLALYILRRIQDEVRGRS